jgi:hypothetical protein
MATVVTSKGREIIAGRMRGSTPTQAEPLFVGWGTNPVPTTAAVSDVAPFTEASESRATGTSSIVTTTTTNDTYQVVGTITVAGSGKTIAEVALFDSATKATTNTVAAGGVVGSAVSTTLNTASTFTPGNNAYIQIRGEVMQVTAGSGSTALTVTRGANGSSAISTIAAADVVTPGNAPGSTVVAAGNMYLHGDFTGLALNVGDAIQFTVQVKHT